MFGLNVKEIKNKRKDHLSPTSSYPKTSSQVKLAFDVGVKRWNEDGKENRAVGRNWGNWV